MAHSGSGNDRASDGALERLRERELFLRVVADRTPQVLDDLAKIWDSCSRDQLELAGRRDARADWSRKFPGFAAPVEYDGPDTTELDEPLRSWADRWDLGAPWILATCVATLRSWSRTGAPFLPLQFASRPGRTSAVANPVGGRPERREWDGERFVDWIELTTLAVRQISLEWEPTRQTREQVHARLDAELDRIEASTTETNAPQPSMRHQVNDHLLWLVQWQVLRMPKSSIAKEAGRDRKTVQEALQNAAGRLGIELRPA